LTLKNEVALEIDTPILFEIFTSVRLTRIRLVFLSLVSAGFAENVTEDALRNKFSVFGKIRSVRIPRDLHTKQHRGYGFITFDDPESAKAAVQSELQMGMYFIYGQL
jgi:hypothetical protein